MILKLLTFRLAPLSELKDPGPAGGLEDKEGALEEVR